MVLHKDNFRHNGAIFRVTLKSTMAKLRAYVQPYWTLISPQSFRSTLIVLWPLNSLNRCIKPFVVAALWSPKYVCLTTTLYLYATNCYVQFVHSCIRKPIESGKIYLHCLKFTKMLNIKLKLVVKDDVNKTQTRAFFSAKNTGNSAKRRRRIQTALTYFAARRRQLITVCVLSLLLVVSRRMTVTHQYSRSCRRLERNNGWFSTV